MTRTLQAGAAALALLAGCAHAGPTQAALSEARVRSTEPMARCPMSIPGTRVSAADSRLGEVLTFTTAGPVDALRSRVEAMAEQHNLRHSPASARLAARGGVRSWRRPALAGATTPPSYATVLDVAHGASLTVRPDAPDDLAQVRAVMRQRAWHLQRVGCGTAASAAAGPGAQPLSSVPMRRNSPSTAPKAATTSGSKWPPSPARISAQVSSWPVAGR